MVAPGAFAAPDRPLWLGLAGDAGDERLEFGDTLRRLERLGKGGHQHPHALEIHLTRVDREEPLDVGAVPLPPRDCLLDDEVLDGRHAEGGAAEVHGRRPGECFLLERQPGKGDVEGVPEASWRSRMTWCARAKRAASLTRDTRPCRAKTCSAWSCWLPVAGPQPAPRVSGYRVLASADGVRRHWPADHPVHQGEQREGLPPRDIRRRCRRGRPAFVGLQRPPRFNPLAQVSSRHSVSIRPPAPFQRIAGAPVRIGAAARNAPAHRWPHLVLGASDGALSQQTARMEARRAAAASVE